MRLAGTSRRGRVPGSVPAMWREAFAVMLVLAATACGGSGPKATVEVNGETLTFEDVSCRLTPESNGVEVSVGDPGGDPRFDLRIGSPAAHETLSGGEQELFMLDATLDGTVVHWIPGFGEGQRGTLTLDDDLEGGTFEGTGEAGNEGSMSKMELSGTFSC